MTTVSTTLDAAAASGITINVMTVMDVGAILKAYPSQHFTQCQCG